MSGPRITRKVTVEVGKKVTESTNVPSSVVQPSSSSSSSSSTRRSVFERLGPGAVERSKGRDTYTPDKCRNWLRDGRCPYGSNCKFLHGPYTDPKPRTKSVRSIVHSGSKDRYDDADEKQQLYHSRSFDSADFDDDDVRETPKLKRRHKSEEELSDSSSIKKTTKTKKKRKEDVDADDEGKIKRKRKTHRKREGSPKAQPRSDDEEEYDRPKTAGDWEEHGDLDFERQLELERRRQDLQRQLALMDEEDAAVSAGENDWKGKDKEEDRRKVPIVHSKLHPEPSPSAPDGEMSTQVVKKKKKKKLDSEGKKTKVKKEASPRRKEETKRKVAVETGDDESMVKKVVETISKKKKTSSVEYAASSDEGDISEHPPTERVSRKVSRHADQLSESHSSPSSARPDERKRHEEEQIRQKREEPKPAKDRRRVEMGSDDQGHVDEGRPRRVRGTSQDYYPSTDEQDDEGRKVRSRVTGVRRPTESKCIDEGVADDRGRRREGDYRGPCTPSPPPHPKDDRYYYDELQEDSKKRRLPRGPPPSTAREPTRDESIQRKESRSRSDDPHLRGPRTPSDDESRFSPPPNQGDSSRGSRYAERERGPPRREPRDKGPVGDQDDQRYSDNRGRANVDSEYERRKPRDEDTRARRPPDHIRNRDDEYPKHRGRGDNYPRDNREDDFQRHRSEREEMKDDRGKYRDERPDDVRSRAREDVDFPRGRGRDEPYDEGRGRPAQRDIHRRMHDDPGGHERDIREERDRPRAEYDSRGRYGGPADADHYGRPSPSQGPPRGRSPPHRYEDRRRPDETFRSGPQGRDPPGRGRAVGRGRNSYTPQYDSRGKMVDNRRRSPPPPGPRSTYQDRDRGPPRGRDVPIGRGRGYLDKGRPPNDRYRDPNVQWERRGERDYPPRDPVVRDRRARESSPPPHPPAYRDERTWEENERREIPQQSGHFPAQERRDPYDADRDSKGRVGNRERHSLDRGPSQWEYDDHANQAKALRKRTRPIAGRSESPFEAKKGREQSPISPDEVPDADNASADAVQPDTPKKPAVVAKDVKKVKKKKKEGKVAKVTAVEGLVEGTATDAMPIKAEKKGKKEKKLKEKGTKKKKKAALIATAPVVPLIEEADVQSVADSEQPPTDKPVQPKIGKKRKQVIAQVGDVALKEPEKPKKKKKKKHQPEVLVQPWNDLEGEEDQEEEAPKVEEKPVQETIPTEKSQDDVFSDWSDDSPVGDDSWLEQDTQQPTIENKDEPVKDSPVLDVKGPSFDDVYDPISDDEFEAMYTHSDDEELAKEEKETTKALGVEDVDWSSLGISHDVNKEKEPASHLERFKPSYVFSRIGISPALAGQRLTQLVLEATAKPNDPESKKVEELRIPEEGPKSIGAFVAAAAAKKRERKGLLGNLGPCRRALCARRDLAIRKQLGKSAKFGKLSLFAASPTTPGDNELFEMSVALYKKESTSKDGVRIIPSKVGSILLSQA